MSPSCLPPFNSSAIRIGMSELSNILVGPQWLDFYIRLIPTEAASPSFRNIDLNVLKVFDTGRVFLGDIWQIVGECLLEAQREESLRGIIGDGTVRGIEERTFMEEKRARCQLEVSLCSQAIDCVQQRCIMPMRGTAAPIVHGVNPFSATSICVAKPATPHSAQVVAYLTAVKQKCEGWLKRQRTDLTPATRNSSFKRRLYRNGSTSSTLQFTVTHRLECQTSVIVNVSNVIVLLFLAVLNILSKFIDPSFCLSSTWVPPGVQDALNEARKAELSAQAGLMAMYLDLEGYNSHQRNTNSELVYLRARMHRAKAEVEVYELAIENALASNFPDNDIHAPAASSSSSSSSSRPNIPPLLPEDVCRYKDYINAESMEDSSSAHSL
ncbi:hypothetical protein BDR05DRAFT_951224 [Suillus weaverae]|nr:hypothetical protein BDR05DRAFT_951224 [Suillus weaverae]